eukprot:637282-Pelagomonas_calceolata.AAC.1
MVGPGSGIMALWWGLALTFCRACLQPNCTCTLDPQKCGPCHIRPCKGKLEPMPTATILVSPTIQIFCNYRRFSMPFQPLLDGKLDPMLLAARDGKLDPVIGRDEEVRRCIQILSRRTKNNPVLIGEPGVGKVRPHACMLVLVVWVLHQAVSQLDVRNWCVEDQCLGPTRLFWLALSGRTSSKPGSIDALRLPAAPFTPLAESYTWT